MKGWILFLVFIALFVFLTALFLTPDFTQRCTVDLLNCVEENNDLGLFKRLWAHLMCVFRNVGCVLGGLFI